jgi:starch synthase (maltosyl-transferring)
VAIIAKGSRRRVVIENVQPEIDDGRFAIKRTVGERVIVTADAHADGHNELSAILLYRPASQAPWEEIPMRSLGNDRWIAEFTITRLEPYFYTVQGWVNSFQTWRRDLEKRLEAGQDVSVELLVGAEMLEAAARRAGGEAGQKLGAWANRLSRLAQTQAGEAARLALDEELAQWMDRYGERRFAATYDKSLAVTVDREKARFSTWYEMFPRSCSPNPARHGTFRDCLKRLPYIAEMGFDVLYFPPVHPIGRTGRRGKNNTPHAVPEDVGSPWAIGASEGGHKSMHPQLRTLEDFRELVKQAKELGLEIALDLAFQCSPDHPYVREHPQWFRLRPDGTVQCAENPPKQYDDIYPLDFETDDAAALWDELKSIVMFWIEQGVRIFRVDNPHTKPYDFWEWLIAEVKRDHPDVIFLAEAFTRPKVMYELAKLGFTQSYTYFAWRNVKDELIAYFTELTQGEVREFYRPSLWPNTPDILTEYLQYGGRPAFLVRLILAATLGANYGIYGPAFELCENRALRPGSEDYLDSEKYQLRHWEIDRADSLKDLIGRTNRIRRENPALQTDWSLRFHPVDNPHLIAYSKHTEDLSNIILTVVNLDPHYTQSGWLELPLDLFRLDPRQPYQAHDLLTDERYFWHGPRNYVELDPREISAHIFALRRRIRTEHDFDYYL